MKLTKRKQPCHVVALQVSENSSEGTLVPFPDNNCIAIDEKELKRNKDAFFDDICLRKDVTLKVYTIGEKAVTNYVVPRNVSLAQLRNSKI